MNKNKIAILTSILGIVGLSVLFGLKASAATSTQSIIIPMYKYPSKNAPLWEAIYKHGNTKIPYTIVNPNNGPSDPLDVSYQKAMTELSNRGFNKVGYVAQTYQKRDIKELAKDIDTWFKVAPDTKAIFIDEMASGTPAQRCYVANTYNYIKVKYPGTLVIQNPGTYLQDEEIGKYADIFTTAETDVEKYLDKDSNRWKNISNFEKDSKNSKKIYHIVYGIRSEAEQQKVLELSRERNAGFIYFTSKTSNYYRDPSDNFDKLIESMNLPATQPEVGTPVELPEGCEDVFNLKVKNKKDPENKPTQPSENKPVEPAKPADPKDPKTPKNPNNAEAKKTDSKVEAPNTGSRKSTKDFSILIAAGIAALPIILTWIIRHKI